MCAGGINVVRSGVGDCVRGGLGCHVYHGAAGGAGDARAVPPGVAHVPITALQCLAPRRTAAEQERISQVRRR